MDKKELAQLDVLYTIIERLRKHDKEMPAQAICTLLLVAMRPGISITEISSRLSIEPPSATRNVQKFLKIQGFDKKTEAVKKGMNFIHAEEKAQDRREKELYLTPEGERLMKEIVGYLT